MAYPTNLDNLQTGIPSDAIAPTTPTGSAAYPHDDSHRATAAAVEALEAKVGIGASPASSAAVGSVLTITSAGVSAYSATSLSYVTGLPTDGVTVCTATIQAAIDAAFTAGGGDVYIKAGTFTCPGLVMKSRVRLHLTPGTILRTATTDLISISGDRWEVWGGHLTATASGGHIFSQSEGVAQAKLLCNEMTQNNPAKSIWEANGFLYIDMICAYFTTQCASNNTVPAWNFVGAGGDVNRNTWTNGRHTYSSGAPVFKLDSTSAVSYYYDNVWRDINFEVCVGGAIYLGGFLNPTFDNCHHYDAPNCTADFISLGSGSTGGLVGRVGSIRNCGRRAVTFNAGFYMVKVRDGSTVALHFESNSGTTGSLFTVDLNSSFGHTCGARGVWDSFINGTPSGDGGGGNLTAATVGSGLMVKEGTDAKQGVTTLVGGTKVVANTSVTASSRILLTVQSLGTVTAPKAIGVTARTAGTSFTITSADATDTSVVAFEMFEPAA